jgi:rhamnosyl/mannosyltransferase
MELAVACLALIALAIVTRYLRGIFGGRPSGVELQGDRRGESALMDANGRRAAIDRRSGIWPRTVLRQPGGHGAPADQTERRLRILVITSEAPPIVSGISRSVDRLATGLRDRGHHVDVLSSVQIPRLVLGEVRLSSLAAFWPALARRLRDYDVVNLHGPVPTMSDAFLLLCRLTRRMRCPIVYTHHCAVQIAGAERLCAVYDRIHRALSARVTLTLTTSRYYADRLNASGGRPVRVVPWGVDLRPKRLCRHAGLRPLRVLFVGQMRPYKGVESLLSAVVGCHGIELILVGGGDRLDEYRLLAAELDGGTDVRFLGRVSDDELLAQYDRSDVIVLPSVTTAEAFGLVVLEGMAEGCVPVVSDLPGVRELVSRAGVVVPPRDVHRLRTALLELAGDRVRLEHLSRAARHRAEGLGWDTCVARYEEALFAAVGVRHAGQQPTARPAGAPKVAAESGLDHRRRIPVRRARPDSEPEWRPAALSRTGGDRSWPAASVNGQFRSGGRG